MILTTHILSGAALGANVQNPYAVAGLSIVLHFLLDFFPHGDYLNKKSRLRDCWKGVIDVLFGLCLAAFVILFREIPLGGVLLKNIAIGIFFSLLPDSTTFFYLFLKMKFLKIVYSLHQNIHKIHYPDFAPEREFRLRNNFWDVFISLVSLIALIVSLQN